MQREKPTKMSPTTCFQNKAGLWIITFDKKGGLFFSSIHPNQKIQERTLNVNWAEDNITHVVAYYLDDLD